MVHAPEFLDYKAQNHVFSDVLGGASMEVLYNLDNSTYRVRGALIDPQAFPVLGLKMQSRPGDDRRRRREGRAADVPDERPAVERARSTAIRTSSARR